MEIAEKIFSRLIKNDEFLQNLKLFIELPETTQQKLFDGYISSPYRRYFCLNSTIDELYKAANNKDYHVFNSLIDNVNLSKFQADEIIKVIDLCISLDMIALAFDLATKAKELYPQHEKIESAYKALSPPKIIGIRPPQAKGVEKSQKWFRENASHHKGKWVAINDGRLLAEADSLKELKTKIDEKYMNPSTVIEKILR